MAAAAETEQQPEAAPKALRAELVNSASSFPQSFPLLDRNSSNASSIVTDCLETGALLAAEQQDALTSVLENDEEQLSSGTSTAEPSSPRGHANSAETRLNGSFVTSSQSAALTASQSLQNGVQHISTPSLQLHHQEPKEQAEENGSAETGLFPVMDKCKAKECTSGTDGPAKRSIEEPKSNAKQALLPLVVDADPIASPEPLQQLTSEDIPDPDSPSEESKEATLSNKPEASLANEETEAKSSESSLSAASEPFVPSAPSSQQVTPRGHEIQPTSSSASARLNANAAAFVPSAAAPNSAASDESSGTTWQTPLLQFGSLPEDLKSMHLPNHNDVSGYNSSQHAFQFPENGSYNEAGEWQQWNGDFDYGPYESSAYSNGNDCQYYQQEDGQWVSYWDGHRGEDGQWHGYEPEHSYESYPHDGYSENDMNGRPQRSWKNGKRGSERRRESKASWQSAVVDVLESQFCYSREALQEMLDMHEGNLEVALDMLAQLEAELDGQLPASGQDAPELNEENFPSLSSSAATPAPKAAKGGFASAVRAPAAPSITDTKASKDAVAKTAEVPPHPQQSMDQVSWKETGAAVSEAYADARSVARDHARLRNMYFQEATKAYLAGNKALAKELSSKGREQSELMKSAHAEASQAIYRHRNPISGRRGKAQSLIDLHGLHVKEALAALEGEIENARRLRQKPGRSGPMHLSVLVGLGKHTKGSKTPARLPAAVEDWLQASQIPFTSSAPGLLELTI